MQIEDLIIFAGQSNMQGQCGGDAITERVENAYEYRHLQKKVLPLTAPVGENILKRGGELVITKEMGIPEILDSAALLAPCDGSANTVPAFMQAFTLKTGRPAACVHTAKGSTQIDYWLKGGEGYTAMKEKVLTAIREINPKRVFFVWLQGESDAIAGVKEQEYYEKLLLLNAQLKEAFGIEKFGVIRVGVFTMTDADQEIMRAQDRACRENEGFLMLTDIAETLFHSPRYMNPHEHGHYSAEGAEILGTLAGSKFGEYAVKTREN